MAKIQPLDTRPMGNPNSWSRSIGTHIAGRAYLDEADQTAADMETKWGSDRLRLLVSPELREKFDRQRYLLNQAIWHGDLEAVRHEAQRMVRGYLALDAAATSAGKSPLPPTVWEIALENGTVAAIVRDGADAKQVTAGLDGLAQGRAVAVYTLEEIGRFLSVYPDIAAAKQTFPGATVTQIRRTVEDPLNAIADSDRPLDDVIPF